MIQAAGGADVLTDSAMVVLHDRPLVPLSPTISEFLAECEATGRTLQIVTPSDARITVPLRTSKAQWIVHDNGYYEGLTGRPMHWDGAMFVPVPDARNYAPTYTTPLAAPISPQLVLTLQATHTPDAPLGQYVHHLMHLFTGHPPAGWGLTEPLQHPWDTADLTAHVRTTPNTRLIAVPYGTRPAIATASFTPLSAPSSGIAETTTLTIGYGPNESVPVDDVPSLIGELAAEAVPTTVLARIDPGRPDLTIEPRWAGPSSPIGLAAHGTFTGPPGFARRHLGPLTWFPLGEGRSPDYWHRHQTLQTFLRTSQDAEVMH
ncbi:DUF6177 family protein [Actinomadura sp. WMMB 499]|uniref:DUF6177 family protein n=1 Tax=Actinomadura sp. WMMB 499 TaxID=1219491 RepID=UPI001246FDE0|nr:DUF6177 family protein [Actinomadura sp. WMMB 499]QFG21668.1 hypothetical protein F7P10_11490 [Actinomadura sp. WMMB 499]